MKKNEFDPGTQNPHVLWYRSLCFNLASDDTGGTMGNLLLKQAVRTFFMCTSRQGASRRAKRYCDKYLTLAKNLDHTAGGTPVRVPPMPGVDPDMRNWSYYMLLSHNVIVNQCITAVTCQLARDEPLSGMALIDPKTDVMPSPAAGPEQVAAFSKSVADHIREVSRLDRLRGSRRTIHPVFGPFDAHQWHCMFGFHLKVHYKQAVLTATGSGP
ncbi:MAG TPA: hypothetical protein DHV36_06210 [Desulfobacteraceae bacterium]|nr:hypothetical protein [Desulfobacteraceae bacterium]